MWNFVAACTQGTSELSGSHFNSRFNCGEHFLSDTHLSEAVSWSKFMERYLIVVKVYGTLSYFLYFLYITNECCFSHLHMAISDLVDWFISS